MATRATRAEVENRRGHARLAILSQTAVRSHPAAYLAALLSLFILALGSAGYYAYRFVHPEGLIAPDPLVTPFWGPAQINSYFARLVLMYDSTAQRLALRLDVLGLVVFLLLAPYLKRFLPPFRRVPLQTLVKGFVVFASVAIYVLQLRREGLFAHSFLKEFIGLALAVGVAALALYTRRRLRHRLAIIVLLAVVVAANVPGFFRKLDLTAFNDFDVIFSEHHFSLVLGQAERLAAGHPLGEMVTPQYGILLHFFLAVFQRHIAPLSMGQIVWVLDFIQLIYLLLCVKVFARHSRGNFVLCLLGVALVLPCYDFVTNAVGPNQSAWRTLAFPFALFLIPLLHRRSLAWSSFVIGIVSGWTLLLNIEAGIAATGGLVAYLLYRAQFIGLNRKFQTLTQLTPFLPGLIMSLLFFVPVWRLFLGYWPDPSVAKTAIEKLLFWSSSSFAGLRYPGDLMPVLLLAGSVFMLLYAALSERRPSVANGVRVAGAGITIIWLSYYVNRAAFWNLSGFVVLFGLGAIDAVRGLMIGFASRQFLSLATLSCLAITGIVTVPIIDHTIRVNRAYFSYHRWSWNWKATGNSNSVKAAEVSGIFIKEEIAEKIQQKAEGLQRFNRSEPLVFLTLHSYLIPKVAGLYSQLPAGDLMGESQRRLDYDRLVNSVKTSAAKEIYVDPLEETSEEPNYYFLFYKMLLNDVQDTYSFDRSADGWEVWVRKDAR